MTRAEPAPVFGAPAVGRSRRPPRRPRRLRRCLAAAGIDFQAHLGVGHCTVAIEDRAQLAAVRTLAGVVGGHVVVVDAPDELRDDPWGPPVAGLAIMRRLKAAFDPAGVLNRGQFIGDPSRHHMSDDDLRPPPIRPPGTELPGVEAPAAEDIVSCVSCGPCCLPHCPTFASPDARVPRRGAASRPCVRSRKARRSSTTRSGR